MSRLPQLQGEFIDRSTPVQFEFEGRRVQGYAGDTISSALAANGVRVLGRSFKYHRRRGLLSAADHDANALMQVRDGTRSVPNVRADVVPVAAGWRIAAVNTRGSLARDRMAVLDRLGAFLPVGFYYKAFHSRRWFPRWERMFRALTGLGAVDLNAGRRRTPKAYDFCDVLVIGAGPSGLAAAVAAAARGAAVLLVDEQPAAGGSGRYARGDSTAVAQQTAALLAAVAASGRIRVLSRAYACGYYADHWVALVTPDCLIKVRARSVIVAQGAYERRAAPDLSLRGATGTTRGGADRQPARLRCRAGWARSRGAGERRARSARPARPAVTAGRRGIGRPRRGRAFRGGADRGAGAPRW